MKRLMIGASLALIACLMVGCNTRDDHGSSTQFNNILNGRYWYLSFSRSVSTTINPDLQARAGIATGDGTGTITYGPNFGSPLPAMTRTYLINSNFQIDNQSDEPGTILGGGEFFQFADLDRVDNDDVGIWLQTKAATGMNVDRLVDSGVSGTYHAFLIRFNRPGIVTGTGNATISKNSSSTASWVIDYTLSSTTSLQRSGALALANDGAVSVQDATTSRSYTGFAEENGDWLAWIETDATSTQVVRVDILVRKGSGLGDASLNGRFNLAGFYEGVARPDVDTLYGRMRFDGQGNYNDFTTRNSFGNASTTGNGVFNYSVASDGVLTFLGGNNPIGFVTRNSARRWFIFPDVEPTGNPASLGFFIATER